MPKKRTNVFLTLGKTINIDVPLLEDSNTLEGLVIGTTKNAVINNDSARAHTSIRAKDLRTLPTISRSAAAFTRLDPAATRGSVEGRNNQFNNFTLDGSILNNPFRLVAATPRGHKALLGQSL